MITTYFSRDLDITKVVLTASVMVDAQIHYNLKNNTVETRKIICQWGKKNNLVFCLK